VLRLYFAEDNDTSAPLYLQYEGHGHPQRAYLEFDPGADKRDVNGIKTEDLQLVASCQSALGVGVPEVVFYKRVLRFYVSPKTSRAALESIEKNERVRILLQSIKDGYKEVIRSNNRVGQYSQEAIEAVDSLQSIFAGLKTVHVSQTWDWDFVCEAL
jgi:hypothetical protein